MEVNSGQRLILLRTPGRLHLRFSPPVLLWVSTSPAVDEIYNICTQELPEITFLMKRISKPLWLNTKGCRWLCTFAWHFPRFQTNLYHGKGLERVLSGWWVNTSSENGFNHIKQGKVRHSTCMCWSQLTKSKTDLTFLAEVGHGLRDRQFDLSWAKTCLGDKHLATHYQNHLTSIIVRNREQVTEG